MTVVVTNLLCFALFMLMTMESLPQNSDHVPIISVFYLVLMAESCLSVCMACCVLTVYYRGKEESPPKIPPWLLRLFLKSYSKLFGTDTTSFSSKLPVIKSINQQLSLLLAISQIDSTDSSVSLLVKNLDPHEVYTKEPSKVIIIVSDSSIILQVGSLMDIIQLRGGRGLVGLVVLAL